MAAAERPSSLLGLVGSVGSGSPEYGYVHGMVMREKKKDARLMNAFLGAARVARQFCK